MSDDSPRADDKPPADRLGEVNDLLAEWAAHSTEESEALVRRLESMGYAVAGKSRDEIAEVLRHPPGRPASQ